MSATEEVLEQIPDAVIEDTAEVVLAARNNPYVLIGVGLVAGSVGAFAGYKLAQKRLRMYYKDIADAEIEQAKEYYSSYRIKKSPEELAAEIEATEENPHHLAATEAFREYAGQVPKDVEAPAETEEELMSDGEKALHRKNGVPEETPEEESTRTVEVQQTTTRKHVFEGRRPAEGEFDYDAEEVNRRSGRPYVITHDEFFEGERDYEQTHLTYYNGDDVLVDDREQPIPDEEAAVGNDNLTRFGYGSKDENIVYVRNEAIEVDFEITRVFGKFAEEVLGFDSDDDERGLKHSSGHGGIRKFRTGRDD